MNFFGKLRDFLTHPTHKRTLGIAIMLVLAAAVSLTVVLSQQQQTIRQRAAGSSVPSEAEIMAKRFPLCASDPNLNCQDNTTVDQNYPSKYKKCLSTPGNANFRNADRINGKSLTSCITTRSENDNYRRIDEASDCMLFSDGKIFNSADVPVSICDAGQIQEDIKATADYYPSCWDGNDPPALDCEASAVNLPCSSEKPGYNKCLSTRRSDGADIITRKFLVCCNAKEYGLVNDKCTLVADGEYSDPQCKTLISPSTSTSTKSYPLCWGGSFTVNTLSGCELNITEDASCSSGYNKCLSANRISGAEEIDDKYLTCCNASEYGFTGNDECTLVADGEYSDPQCSIPIKKPAKESYKCTTYGYAKNDECKGESTSKINETDSLPDDSRTAPCAPLMDPLDNGDTWYSKTVCVKSSDITTNPTGSAKLTITNPSTNPSDPIVDHKGDLSYSFTGFKQGNIDVWVNKRDESGVDNRTGGIANATAGENNSGNSIILGLTEPAGKYTLWAKGSNGVSASAIFTVKPTLTIKNPDSTIKRGDNLNFEFKGFDLNEQVTVGVVGGGSITPITAANGAGDGFICCLTELADTYELKATGTSGHSATAPFTVIAAAASAPGDTVIRLPAGAFATLFTTRRKAVNEQIAHKNKSLTIYLYNSTKDTKAGVADYSVQSATELSSSEEDVLEFNLGNNVTPGTYKILLKNQKYLRTLVKTMSITVGINTIETLDRSLADGAGDVNDDNVIDILDYNIIIGCHSDKADTSSCTNKEGADLNDDEKVDQLDYNIYMTTRGFKDGD